MRRFIVTGAPGAGKTAIVRQLQVDGYSVVEEAATDVIAAAQHRGSAEPWREASFIDAVADLQKQRQLRASHHREDIQFHDRSAVCTAALAVYLGYSISPFLAEELDRVNDEATSKHASSSYGILDSSPQLQRGESALKNPCALSESMKRLTSGTVSNSLKWKPQVWWSA